MMSSQIVGNILITFVLGAISKVAYFIVLTALGSTNVIMKLPVHFYSCGYPTWRQCRKDR